MQVNGTGSDHPKSDCIHERFEAQAERSPHATAVVFEAEKLTYGTLNSRANRLAHYLRKRGVGPEVLVGLCLERSLEMIVGILGVLKAGAAYVPLDPTYPGERLSAMLGDAKPAIVLTQEHLIDGMPRCPAGVILLDTEDERIARERDDNVLSGVTAANLAYVIFTSGSSGRPKGVQIAHHAVVTLIDDISHVIKFDPDDIWTAAHSYAFDYSVWEIWGCMLHGGRLVVLSQNEIQSPARFYDLLFSERVTVLNQTPTALRQLLLLEAKSADLAANSSLRLIICGGEALPQELALALNAWNVTVWNFYGPTEATVWSAVHRVRLTESNGPSVPIGRPLANTRFHILDASLQPRLTGAVGELHISGAGLARGYLGSADLTAEKFVPDPFAQEPGMRLYKTGDLARRLADETIEFVGRVDHQVKIRGYRVELAEIEGALRRHPSVREAVALARERSSRDRRLEAYIVAQRGHRPTSRQLRHFLRGELPEYMVPSAFVLLDRLPLTTNGKLDRQALPPADQNRLELQDATVHPRNPREQIMARLWAEVFNLEAVGVHDDFFDLGGHSLLATQITSRMRDVFHVELPMTLLFENPTVAGLTKIIEDGRVQRSPGSVSEIKPVKRDGPLPLSFSQKRVWFLQRIDSQRLDYNFQATVRFTGELDIAALERSLGEILRRHEIYRSTFPETSGEPVQIIHPSQPFRLHRINLEGLSGAERQLRIKEVLNEEFHKPFQLAELPLIRWTLMRIRDREHLLVHVEHHLVHDGWSFNVFCRELLELYNGYSAGIPSPLPELPIQFADFAHWQQNWMQGDAAKSQLTYWKTKLEGGSFLPALPCDRPRPPVQTFHGAAPRTEINAKLCAELAAFSRRQGVTLFMTMLGALFALLARYTGQEDICVGSGIANRRFRETEGLIGMLVNNIALRVRLAGDPTFRELLAQVRETTLEAYAHQDVPFEKVVEALRPKRDLSYNPIFQVMFNFHDARMHAVAPPGLELDLGLVLSNDSAKFDLNLIVIPHYQQHAGQNHASKLDPLTVIWEYNTDLFDVSTIARMQSGYQSLLEGLVADPDKRISELPLLTASEKHRLLVDWNDTGRGGVDEQCIHRLFEQQAEKRPDATAVVFGDQRLSYRELNQRSNQLAHYLIKLGIGADTVVGVCMQRSIDMIVGLLGILKAGGAYVPLDPNYPQERLAFMVEDSRAAVLLTQKSLSSGLPQRGVRLICVDRDREGIARESDKNPQSEAEGTCLAYVIYTSGSTGRPKGVGIEHRSVIALLHWAREVFSDEDLAGVLFSTSISFDLSVFELFVPLSWGGKVILAENVLSLSALSAAREVTLINAVPSAMPELLRTESVPGTVRTVNLAGEPLSTALVNRLYRRGIQRVYDLYGPSEATTYSTFALRKARGPATIGRPVSNTQVYLLDSRLHPVPIGVAGELYIGGAGLARGYFRRADLTAEKFVPNPFSTEPGARLYSTGDLGRYLPDGNIEFLGRKDNQVKIRGFRVELGEIEAILGRHPSIRELFVTACDESAEERRLIAYAVAVSGVTLSPSELRDYLRRTLPEYMIPSSFVQLDCLPLTPNGKVDRKALPAPAPVRPELDEGFVAPRTSTEELIAKIWSQVLNVDEVGVHDNFFDLGGHSLTATQVLSRLTNTFLMKIPLRMLFEHPTVGGMAEQIEEKSALMDAD